MYYGLVSVCYSLVNQATSVFPSKQCFCKGIMNNTEMALIFSHEEGLENGWETFFSLSPRSCGLVLLTDGVKTDG